VEGAGLSQRARAGADSHSDDLTPDGVWERFCDDLSERGVSFQRPAEPLTDPDWIDLLARNYIREPTVFDPAGA
jgi:hypothetical protein